jgi:hypothetical protein
MPCSELDRLRQEISSLRIKLREKSAAREQAQELSGKLEYGDFETYLKRKIERVAREIEGHVRQHKCQEG